MAGVWFGLKNSELDPNTGKPKRKKYDCNDCKGRKKELRNCRNNKGYKYTIADKEEWREWTSSIKPEKFGPLRLYECPLTAITPTTWKIIRIVNQTSDENGIPNNLTYEGLKSLPPWLRQAYEITQEARAEYRRRKALNG